MTQTLKQDHSGSNPALSFGPNHLPLCTLVSSHKTWGIIISPSHRVSFRIEWISISKELKIIFAIYRAHTTSMYYTIFVNWNFKKVFWHCSLWPNVGYLQDILISSMVLLFLLYVTQLVISENLRALKESTTVVIYLFFTCAHSQTRTTNTISISFSLCEIINQSRLSKTTVEFHMMVFLIAVHLEIILNVLHIFKKGSYIVRIPRDFIKIIYSNRSFDREIFQVNQEQT